MLSVGNRLADPKSNYKSEDGNLLKVKNLLCMPVGKV